MPLLERVRIEVYIPDLPTQSYRNLLIALDQEFTYTFGGCTVVRGYEGSYLSQSGSRVPDRINLIYTDMPFALSENIKSIEKYADELKRAAFEALSEEAILVVVQQVYHST